MYSLHGSRRILALRLYRIDIFADNQLIGAESFLSERLILRLSTHCLFEIELFDLSNTVSYWE